MTPQKMVDSSGVVVWSAEYKTFGEVVIDPTSTIENNLRFPGQYYDAELGLHYNYTRTYSSCPKIPSGQTNLQMKQTSLTGWGKCLTM
jgi:hypothetical protein